MSSEAPTQAWRIVAEREITTRVREKSFRWSLVAMVVGVVATIVLTSILGGKPDSYTVGVVDGGTADVVASSETALDALEEDSTVAPRTVGSAEAAEAAVRGGDVDAALLPTDDGYELVGDSSVDSALASALTAAAGNAALADNAAQQGVDLDDLRAGTQVVERLLDPDDDQSGERTLVAFVFVLLFYLTAVTFGMTIAQSVVQEKESRVVEILAAAVPIRALLWGKVLGNTVLALGQIVVLVVVGVSALAAVGETELLSAIGPAVVWYVAFFALGFVALSSLWAVAGSLASRTEDLQSTTLPGNMLLLIPYMLTFLAGEGVKTVASMLPIVSSMLMPARIAEGDVPFWQIGVALVANVVAMVVLVRFGARIYERTLMRTERKIGFGEALKLSG